MNILQTPTFARQVKKFNKNQEVALNKAVQKIVLDPLIGVMKKSDLQGIRVYKFHTINQQILLAYEFHKKESLLVLLAVGPHENFYRNIKG